MSTPPNIDEPASKALNADEVAQRVDYPKATVYRLTREGRFPAPIDATRPTRSWRWSPRLVQSYIDGEWSVAA